MQVFGLSGHIIRSGKLASLIAAQSANNEAAIRRAAVCRWRQAIANGLTAEHAAKAVGVPRASLYRWEKRPELRSKRPKRTRAKTWSPALVEAVETLRLDHPMWGRAKIGPLLRREGFAVSDTTVGRASSPIWSGAARSSGWRHCAGARVVQPVKWRRKHALRAAQGNEARHAQRARSGRYALDQSATR
jgi:putative transposase